MDIGEFRYHADSVMDMVKSADPRDGWNVKVELDNWRRFHQSGKE